MAVTGLRAQPVHEYQLKASYLYNFIKFVEWPEDAAPFQTVARIWIPRQTFDTPGRMAFGENLSFTPWHAIAAHEPLGEINRVRKEVYSRLA